MLADSLAIEPWGCWLRCMSLDLVRCRRRARRPRRLVVGEHLSPRGTRSPVDRRSRQLSEQVPPRRLQELVALDDANRTQQPAIFCPCSFAPWLEIRLVRSRHGRLPG
jgi:hypothetical protein